MTGRYHGQPFAAHVSLPLVPRHFVRWLALFERIAPAVCSPEGVAHSMDKAHRIARSREIGTTVARNELPASTAAPRADAPQAEAPR
jgi:hemoglobin